MSVYKLHTAAHVQQNTFGGAAIHFKSKFLPSFQFIMVRTCGVAVGETVNDVNSVISG